MAISAKPPGDVPKINVAGCKPVAQAKAQPNTPDNSIMPKVPRVTVNNHLGAVRMNCF
jgi:hypothetical protein